MTGLAVLSCGTIQHYGFSGELSKDMAFAKGVERPGMKVESTRTV